MRRATMVSTSTVLGVLLLSACVGDAASSDAGAAQTTAAGGQELPAGHPAIAPGSSSVVSPPPPGSGEGAAGLSWTRPGAWEAETPSSSMRRAQYRVAGAGGDAQCVVFYFGPGQGGDAEANVLRWADQFGQPDGSSSRGALKTETIDVGGMPVVTAEITGIYSGGMGGGAPAPGSMLLGAVAQGPDANWFFKLTGPEATVEANREAFLGLVRSISVGG